jgi:hypothetical protein
MDLKKRQLFLKAILLLYTVQNLEFSFSFMHNDGLMIFSLSPLRVSLSIANE